MRHHMLIVSNDHSQIALPTVHLNGTSRTALEEQVHVAASAVTHALECLQDAAPNARDYYVQGDGAFSKAQKNHNARVDALRAVLAELGTIYESIADQR